MTGSNGQRHETLRDSSKLTKERKHLRDRRIGLRSTVYEEIWVTFHREDCCPMRGCLSFSTIRVCANVGSSCERIHAMGVRRIYCRNGDGHPLNAPAWKIAGGIARSAVFPLATNGASRPRRGVPVFRAWPVRKSGQSRNRFSKPLRQRGYGSLPHPIQRWTQG